MAQLTYNGITFDNFHTLRFDQQVVYDPSGSDYLYTHITIGIKAVLNRSNSPSQDLFVDRTPANTMTLLRDRLLKPCQYLTYKVGNEWLLRSPIKAEQRQSVSGNVTVVNEDAKHGPHPIHCNIQQITERTFLVEYVVETWIVECVITAGGGNRPLPYLSNRWSETHMIDDVAKTKRTVKGRIIFRADVINSKKFNNPPLPNWPAGTADAYRNMVTPPLFVIPSGFRRTSQEYVVAEDGLTLDYTVVDEEVYTQPPPDCMKFEAEHTVSVTNGAVYKNMLRAKVWGDVNQHKSVLILRAARIIGQRLLVSGEQKNIIINGFVTDQFHENVVEIRVETIKGPNQFTYFDGMGMNVAKPENFLLLDGLEGKTAIFQRGPDPGARGTASLAMIHAGVAAYMTACGLPPPSMQQVRVAGFFDSQNVDTSQPPVFAVALEALPTLNTVYDPQETSDGIYTVYRIDIDYCRNRHVLQLPVAGGNGSCSYATVANPTMRKTVKWTAEKYGAMPTLPSVSTNPNLKLLNDCIRTVEIQVAPDGSTPIYMISGEYVYGVTNPAIEGYEFGKPPYLGSQTGGGTRFVTEANFGQGIA